MFASGTFFKCSTIIVSMKWILHMVVGTESDSAAGTIIKKQKMQVIKSLQIILWIYSLVWNANIESLFLKSMKP